MQKMTRNMALLQIVALLIFMAFNVRRAITMDTYIRWVPAIVAVGLAVAVVWKVRQFRKQFRTVR